MKLELKVERRLDYDNQYAIDIDLTENLTKEGYATVTGAIKLIESVLDPYIVRAENRLMIVKAVKGGKNGNKT